MPQPSNAQHSDTPAGNGWVAVAAAADAAGIHIETVRRWIRAGHLASDQSLGVRKTRVRQHDVLRLAAEGLPAAPASSGREVQTDRLPDREIPSQVATAGRRITING